MNKSLKNFSISFLSIIASLAFGASFSQAETAVVLAQRTEVTQAQCAEKLIYNRFKKNASQLANIGILKLEILEIAPSKIFISPEFIAYEYKARDQDGIEFFGLLLAKFWQQGPLTDLRTGELKPPPLDYETECSSDQVATEYSSWPRFSLRNRKGGTILYEASLALPVYQ